MKTYMCDICGDFVDDPCLHIWMKEITYRAERFKKKKRVHLCNMCLKQIAEVSRKKRSDSE